MTSAMKDVVQFGTGASARQLNRQDLAGKTGTTNDTKDAWFVGFNSDIVGVAWMGYDQPAPLYEYGAQAALPMWMSFMQVALAGKPEHTMPEPPGLVIVKIDPATGHPAAPWQKNTTFEVFREGDIQGQHNNRSGWSNPDEVTQDEGYTYHDETGVSSTWHDPNEENTPAWQDPNASDTDDGSATPLIF